MGTFCRFDLRTSDVAAAGSFYRRVLGHDRATIWPLHEQAIARGARPHWLGQIAVADVERTAAAFVERGATMLGPVRPSAAGDPVVVLRDPGGAVVALGTASKNPLPDVGVVWHVLNTKDAPTAQKNYTELLGFSMTEPVELGAEGTFRKFAWEKGGADVGAIGDIAGRPHVHPQWLFAFAVAALDDAVEAARAAGGRVLDPSTLPSGERIFVCEDPQGAAFALRERG